MDNIANAIRDSNSNVQFLNAIYNANIFGMEINKLRVLKLESVISKFKSRAEFARYYGLDATFISQLINGHRNFGEKSARKMEGQLSLPEGWLDTVDAHPLDEWKSVYDKSAPDIRRMILNFLLAVKQQQEQEKENHDRINVEKDAA